MHNSKNRFKFEEWIRYADEDLAVAEITLKEQGPPNQICFHAQQVAEKYLKGFLILSGERFFKIHDLRYLLELCEKIEKSFSELSEVIVLLNAFYIEARYPGDIPEFSEKDAKEALKAAREVRKFVVQIASL